MSRPYLSAKFRKETGETLTDFVMKEKTEEAKRLVNDRQVCDKAYFDAALEDMCSRFLAIPEGEIKGMLNALGTQYPAALVNFFERYIDEMRRFCQK